MKNSAALTPVPYLVRKAGVIRAETLSILNKRNKLQDLWLMRSFSGYCLLGRKPS